MLFNSIYFLLFFPIVVVIYYIIPQKLKNVWLLITSYYFYMSWNPKYVLLIMTSTVITYISGLLIAKIREKKVTKELPLCKLVVAGSFAINLGILFFFKYFLFSAGLFTRIVGLFGIQVNVPAFDIILPVGISFYTFQALSYTMDVYRGEIYAEKNILKYALFVSFFPQLVAGPIERSKNLLKQLSTQHKFNYENFTNGILLMIWGYFLKMVIADRIAIFVDTVYGDYGTYGGMYIVVATMLFAIQIYCDFAGYSIIAMGAASILGIKLMENFYAPYLSTSVGEFWRKWHISLTSWFKDYLYIPLGGSRKGKIRKCINKLIVFFVSGLWHGASLSFVFWGVLNGIYQIVEELLKEPKNSLLNRIHINQNAICYKVLSSIITFILVDFSWLFFRANGLKESFAIIGSVVRNYNPWILVDGSLYQCGLDNKNFGLMIVSILILLIADICKKRGVIIREIILRQDYWARCLIISVSIVFILIFGIYGAQYDASGFIYFQF